MAADQFSVILKYRSLKAFVHWTVPTESVHLLIKVHAVLSVIGPVPYSILDQYKAC